MKGNLAIVSFALVLGTSALSQALASDVTVTIHWNSQADIDLSVINPNGGTHCAERDALRGPASERCVIRNAMFGNHMIRMRCVNMRAAGHTPVSVEVRRGGRIVRGATVTLRRTGQVACLSTNGGNPPDVDPVAGRLVVVVQWASHGADVDLHVVGPGGECYYPQGRRKTSDGGHLLNDCTSGPGKETYVNRRPTPGAYHIELHYFRAPASRSASARVEVFRDGQRVYRRFHTLTRTGQRIRVYTASM